MSQARQKGVALILALMVFAIVSATAINSLTSVQHSLTVADFVQRETQQKQTLLGGEAWALSWFARYNGQTTDETVIMDWQRPWLLVDQTFPLSETGDEGQLHIQIIERQACINVNALADEPLREVTRQRLGRLAQEVDVEQSWINPLLDWVDENQDLAGSDGREDEYYIGLEPHYRTGDTAMASRAELPLLDLDVEVLQKVAPYICMLPAELGVNVNRASDILLKAMSPDFGDEQVNAITARIQSSGFTDINELSSLEALENISLTAEDWRVDSRFIDVYVTLEKEDEQRTLHSMLWKDENGRVAPWFRSFAEFDDLSQTLLPQSPTEK